MEEIFPGIEFKDQLKFNSRKYIFKLLNNLISRGLTFMDNVSFEEFSKNNDEYSGVIDSKTYNFKHIVFANMFPSTYDLNKDEDLISITHIEVFENPDNKYFQELL
jgi:hypothetical protein